MLMHKKYDLYFVNFITCIYQERIHSLGDPDGGWGWLENRFMFP